MFTTSSPAGVDGCARFTQLRQLRERAESAPQLPPLSHSCDAFTAPHHASPHFLSSHFPSPHFPPRRPVSTNSPAAAASAAVFQAGIPSPRSPNARRSGVGLPPHPLGFSPHVGPSPHMGGIQSSTLSRWSSLLSYASSSAHEGGRSPREAWLQQQQQGQHDHHQQQQQQ